MATEVVNSYNIIVDSERCINADSTGDDLLLPLNQTPINCADNQFIRLTLQSFSMYKSWTNVNPNNSTFRITQNQVFPAPGSAANLVNVPFDILNKNYEEPFEVVQSFGDVLAAQLAIQTGIALVAAPGGVVVNSPTSTESFSGTGNLVMDITITFVAAHGYTQPLIIQTKIDDGDCFELLGANRDRDPLANLIPSIYTNVGGAGSTTIQVKGYYNVQTSTQQNIYLHTDAASSNIMTTSYNAENTDTNQNAQMESSRVLGKIIIGNEFATFTSATQMEYFLNLRAKSLTFLRLYLRDSHGRPIPDYQNQAPTSGVAGDIEAGIGSNKQNTLGNRSFEAVIKCDIVQYLDLQNDMLKSKGITYNVPARFGTEPMRNFDYGASGFPDTGFGSNFVNMNVDGKKPKNNY